MYPQIKLLARAFALGFLCTFAAPSYATVYCIPPNDGNSLDNDIYDAGVTFGSHEVRIPAGIYKNTPVGGNGSAFTMYISLSGDANAVTISGGWDPTCNQQSNNPADTKLDGEWARPVLNITIGGSQIPSITLKNLTLQHGYTTLQRGAALDILARNKSAPTIRLDRLIVKLNGYDLNDIAGPGSAINLQSTVDADGAIYLTNSQIGPYNESTSSPAVSILSNSTNTPAFYILSNTFTGNFRNDLGPAGLFANSTGSGTDDYLVLENNVIYNNQQQPDIGVTSTFGTSISRNNHIGILSGSFKTSENTTSGDPKLVIQNGLYVPKPGSPLINSGTVNPLPATPPLDLRGAARIQVATIDRGAVEVDPITSDTIFKDGFDQ